MKALECSQDFSHYKSIGIFPDAHGQITPQSLVESGPNSNLSKILWLSSLPASMEKIRSKMKALACSQHFSHYNPMGAIRCHGHQSSGPKPNASFSLPNDASDKIWSQLAHWSQRYSCLKMFTDAQTYRRTAAIDSHPLSSPCEPSAQVS